MSKLLIQFSHLFKSFGSNLIFDDISLSINQGEIFALIGENGSGKTTLLNLLTGTVLPDAGVFSKASNLSIGFLPQEISLPRLDISARAYIEEGPLSELERQMQACLDQPDRLAEWEKLHERYEQLGGYQRLPIEKILSGLKLETSLLDLSMATLSSGQRVRIALAKALIENPDLLLLDEPTNHLDQEILEWLKKTLSCRQGSTIIVSHDRKFLNETCNHLIEIKNGKLSCYGGNYDFYLKEKEKLLEKQIKAFEAQEEERKILKQKIKAITFSEKKAPPPSDRNIMAYDRRGEHHQKFLQHNLDVLKAKLTEIEENLLKHPKPKNIKGLRFSSTPLASSVAIELDNISKAFGEKILFSDFNKRICKGDRIILSGPNGCGKTTLLRCIAGLLSVDAGVIRYAPTAKIVYLDQEVEFLPMGKTPFEYFENRFNLSEEDLRKELHKAAIGGYELLNRPFSTLSVGQRKRLMLLSLILETPNVLLLDEPTNHLDFLTLEAFETALLNFDGAILAVSHDFTFIDKIANQEWKF
ncbi:MAG: ABC-F family ATP-binding cassette domain-containing protein [Chlamydiae bacterium]|nr:ABC-F family ATP-binding cassette domain-containing protein [Chlamydiota bacterium]